MKKNYSALLFFLITSIFVKNVCAQTLAQDSLALVDLYDSTGGTNWTTKTNWLTGKVSTWYGITVSSNRVTSISIQNNNLVGKLPSSMGNLTNLQSIYLNSNKLTALTEELTNISTLVVIRAESNQFSQFPYFVGKMTQLQELDLGGNSFSIIFPDTLYNLINAMMIKVSNCSFSGSLDYRIANWSKLVWFYFSNNDLSGSIPDEIGSFPNLTFLELNGNNLEGTIPVSIGKLSKLAYLRLYDNKLSGIIPDTIYSITSLIEINLHDNYFSGSVSPTIAKLTNLTKLYLYNDSLSGEFPQINSLTKLQDIRINNNMFNDFPDISTLTVVAYLYLQENRLSFEDIEPNLGVAYSSFDYSPQDSIEIAQSQLLNEGDSITMGSAIGGSANQYQWYKNGSIISGSINDTLVINGVTTSNNGQYICNITSTIVSGLTLYRRPIILTVAPLTSVSEINATGEINIYPNPSENGIYLIDLNNYTANSLQLFDISGNKIYEMPIFNGKVELNLSSLTKGTYLIKLMSERNSKTFKLIH